MNKKEEKFMKLLDEIVQDDSRPPLSKAFMDKVEKLIELYAEVYIKPIVKGQDKFCKMTCNKAPQNVDVEKSMELGATDAKTGDITINIGLLKDVKPGVNYVERRNRLLFSLLGTVAHESRHYFQVRYRQLLEKMSEKDIKKMAFYKQILGDKAEEIADSTTNGLTNGQLEVYITILQITHPELHDQMKFLLEEMKKTNSLYYASAHEQDARNAAIEANNHLLERIVARAEQKFDACKFPEKFEDMTKIFNGVFTPGKPKKRRGKKDDLFGDFYDSIDEIVGVGKRAGKAKNKFDKARGSLTRDFLDFTDGFIKQAETFTQGLQSVSEGIEKEVILQQNQVQVVDQVVDLMKNFSAIELVTYADAISEDSEKELLFAYALKGLIANKYTATFFLKEENIVNSILLMKKRNLNWASDMLEKTFSIDLDDYIENE